MFFILYYQHYRQHFTNHIEFLEMMTYINCLYMGNDESGTYPDKYVDYLKSLFIGTNIDIFTWKNELELYMDRIKSSLKEILSSIRIYLSDYSLKDNSIDQYIQKEFALKKLPISLRQMTVPRIFIIIFLALQEKLKGNQIINSLPENTLHEFFEEVIDSTFERYILARIFS